MAAPNLTKVSKDWRNSEKSCIICGNNESLDKSRGIEVPSNFVDTLNLVWPSLEEGKRCPDENKCTHCSHVEGNDGAGAFEDGRFTEIPPICQGCADGIQAVQHFKSLSDRHLEKLRKSMEEAKKEAEDGSSPLSTKSSDEISSKNFVETQETSDIPMATHPWKPSFLQNATPATLSPAQLSTIERTTRRILNKLTNNGDTFDILTSELVATLPFLKNEDDSPDNQLIIKSLAHLIFDKAVKEPFYGPAYARLTQVISKLSSKFRKEILDYCQSQFQEIGMEECDQEDEFYLRRQRCFGILNFIQDIYNFKFKLVTPKIIVGCVDVLIQPPINQLKLECVYKFLAAEKQEERIPFGQIVEAQLKALTDAVKQGEKVRYIPEVGCMDRVFEKLAGFSKNTQFSGRIRCLLVNLVELRGNGWKKQEKSRKVSKIAEVPYGKALKPFPPSDEPDLTLWLFERKTRAILNKVNLNNCNSFHLNFSRFLKLPFWFCVEYGKTELQIFKAGELIFEKAVKEPMYCDAYARIVQEISQFRRKYPYSRNFEKIREQVVNRCVNEISQISSVDEVESLLKQYKFGKRERIFGVVNFIGELYKLSVFSVKNMGTCMRLLISEPNDELEVECVYRLLMCKCMDVETKVMTYYGESLDAQLISFKASDEGDDADVGWVDGMFGSLKKFAMDSRFGMRMRCLLVNLVELRGNNWKHQGQAVAGIAVSNEEKKTKNGTNGRKKKGRRDGSSKVSEGNWRN